MATSNDVLFYKGGASGIGGTVGSQILSRTLGALSAAISGVTLSDAPNSNVGTGQLDFTITAPIQTLINLPLTGNTTPARYTASATTVTGVLGGGALWNLYDGSTATFCSYNTTPYPITWVLDLGVGPGSPVSIYQYILTSVNASFPPTAWTVDGSNNGSSWTTVDTRSGITWTGSLEAKTFTLSADSNAYRYWRLNMSAGVSASIVQLAEIAYYAVNVKALKYTPPGSAVGGATSISVDGTYLLFGADGSQSLRVAKSGVLPVSNVLASTFSVTISSDNLFGDVTNAGASAGETKYRCVFIKNNHGSDVLSNVKIYANGSNITGEVIALGFDPVAAGIGPTSATPADELTAPAGVSFSLANSLASALTITSLTAGYYKPIWVRRVVPAGSLVSSSADAINLTVTFT